MPRTRASVAVELCPLHLVNERVPLMTAAECAGLNVTTIWRAIQAGRLRAVRFPAGTRQTHWQVRLGDLAEYTGRPLDPRWLAIVEDGLAWTPGRDIARVA